jgi:hypothetical protein
MDPYHWLIGWTSLRLTAPWNQADGMTNRVRSIQAERTK